MPKKKVYIICGIIFILAVFAGIFDYPEYWNQGTNWLNAKKNQIKYLEKLSNIPHFPEIPFKLGLDLQGGTHLVYEADLSQIQSEDYASSMAGLRDVIERRVNLFGVREPVVQTQEAQGRWRLIVELAGVKDVNQAIQMIGKTPYLEFKEKKTEDEVKKIEAAREEVVARAKELKEQGKAEEEIFEELKKLDNWLLSTKDIFKSTPLTGRYLESAKLGFDQTTYKPLVLLQFDKEGAKIFEELTSKNVGKPLAIYIDNILISAPIVQEPISGGKAQITGRFTIEEAKTLARNLNAGALPVPLGRFDLQSGEFKSGEPLLQQTVGATLGEVSLQKSLKAGIFGFAAIILFMIFFYRLPGLLGGIALLMYVVMALALFKLIPITLTLAGIGGFILSIGMAIDANILIFSRLREELVEGKTFSISLTESFRRAWPSIRDGNLTTLIVAVILFSFGTSFVKGFATTLSLGILLSMFSAIFVTRNFLQCFIGTKLEKIRWLWG